MTTKPIFTTLAIAAAITASCNAASVVFDSATLISSNTNFNLSVYDGKAGYAGTGGTYGSVTGTFGDGTAEAYQLVANVFVDNGSGENSSNDIYAYAEKGTWSGLPTYANTGDTRDYELDRGDVWTSNDPGTGFSGGDPANIAGTDWTITGAQIVSGSFDISSFTTGTVYMMAGGYDTSFQSAITMSGVGQADLSALSGSIDPPPSRNMYVMAFTFDNADQLYDSIQFDYTGQSHNRARFMGVVVDGVPEPSTTALIGLGGLALIMRRRR